MIECPNATLKYIFSNTVKETLGWCFCLFEGVFSPYLYLFFLFGLLLWFCCMAAAALQRYSQANSASHFTGLLRTDALPVLISTLMERGFFDKGDRLFSSLCRVRPHSCSLAFKKTIVSIVSPLYCPGRLRNICPLSSPSPLPPPL